MIVARPCAPATTVPRLLIGALAAAAYRRLSDLCHPCTQPRPPAMSPPRLLILSFVALSLCLLLACTPAAAIKKKLTEAELAAIEDQWMEDEQEDEGQTHSDSAAAIGWESRQDTRNCTEDS